MKYPKLNEIPTSRELVDVFKGYNHNLRIGDGEFYDMTNLSSDNYPVLSPRHKRSVYAVPNNQPNGMIAKGAICYVDGSDFVIKTNDYEDRVSMDLTDSKKNLISMGVYVIVMPDKKYINTVPEILGLNRIYEHGQIEAEITTSGTVVFSPCTLDGVSYEDAVAQETPPQNPKDTDLWIDTSETPHQLKQYYEKDDKWSTLATTTYIKISAKGIGTPFSVNDGVEISGVEPSLLSDLNASVSVLAKDDDYLIVSGILGQGLYQEKPLKVTRKMPEMDFIIESGNRLWGCRYGYHFSKGMANEIYASKLGDFKNWNCFMGISTDSYAATIGTDGKFTGAITYLGYPLFFKENCIHKVYGNYPSNYQIQTTACRGVQSDCSKSLAIVNGVLYYKARTGVCAYDGSLPVEISSTLGDMTYHNATAGAIGNKYYISMADETEEWNLFVYDTAKSMWHKEDDTQAVEFCSFKGDLYYIDHADNQIKTVKGTVGVLDTEPIKWNVITGIIGTDSPDKKYISRMDVRMSIEVGARVAFYAEYDSSCEWEHLFTMTGTKLGSFSVPIKPKRCDHMRLKIIGIGESKIYSICKTIEKGSDV